MNHPITFLGRYSTTKLVLASFWHTGKQGPRTLQDSRGPMTLEDSRGPRTLEDPEP